MGNVTTSELRDHGGEVIDRVLAGESFLVTHSGTPVAELRPLRRPALDRKTLLERWRRLPAVDPVRFREDVDAALGDSQ